MRTFGSVAFAKVICAAALSCAISALAQQGPLSAVIRESASLIVIQHVTVIDGTGAAPAINQTVVIRNGSIFAVSPSSKAIAFDGTHVIDGSGTTLISGLVGMHEHLFFIAPVPSPYFVTLGSSFPRLYLASGVTTARTTGSLSRTRTSISSS